jgi:enamine deaminase RidA (YjgF/YER057c/UK114 family)
MTLANIVRLNAYVTAREHMQGYMRLRDRQFPGTPPASTLMVVSGFTRAEFLVEIEAIAAAPDNAWAGMTVIASQRVARSAKAERSCE